MISTIINIPSVARAVLETTKVIDRFSESVSQSALSSKSLKYHTNRKSREQSPPQHVTCHLSPVTLHVSCGACHLSLVMWRMFLFIYLFFGQSVEAYCWRVCYQQGLPSLVFYSFGKNLNMLKSHFNKKNLGNNCNIIL